MPQVEEKRLTLQQQAMNQAIAHVSELLNDSEEARNVYVGLCHGLPVLVRSNGLCQTIAFVHMKAEVGANGVCRPSNDKPLQTAYCRLWNHLAATLGEDPPDLLGHVRQCDNLTYLRMSRKVMNEWVFYRRFAESMLKDSAAQNSSVSNTDAGEEPETP